MKNKIKRVVVYGHFTGSHSYIHQGYYKAFQYMGYESHWISDIRELGGIDLSGTLFLTENMAKSNMPIRKDCYYILHHIDNIDFINVGCEFINLCNYLHVSLNNGMSYNYPIDGISAHGTLPLYPVEKIKDYVYYDKANNAIYQPWATDLLPNEIDDILEFDITKTEINFVGSVWSENINQLAPMLLDCFNKKINVNIYGWVQSPQMISQFPNVKHITHTGTSEEDAQKLVKSSLIYPDIRGDLHRNVGYIPCRLFKNISYGCIPITNSLPSYEFFEKLIPYSDNSIDFVNISTEYLNNRDIEKDRYLINKIKDQHTYVNRIQDILTYFDILYS